MKVGYTLLALMLALCSPARAGDHPVLQAFDGIKVDYAIDPLDVGANPFMYQGKVVEAPLPFYQMKAADEAVFWPGNVKNAMAKNLLQAFGADVSGLQGVYVVHLTHVPSDRFSRSGQIAFVAFKLVSAKNVDRSDGTRDVEIEGEYLSSIDCTGQGPCPAGRPADSNLKMQDSSMPLSTTAPALPAAPVLQSPLPSTPQAPEPPKIPKIAPLDLKDVEIAPAKPTADNSKVQN